MATCLVNLIGVATSLFAMQVYDRVVPTMAYATLTTLVAGMAIVVVLDWTLKTIRARILDSLSCAVDQRLSQQVFEHLLRVQLDAQPRTLGNAGRAGRQPRSRAPVLFRHRRVCPGGSAVRADVSRLHRHHRRRRRVGLRAAAAGRRCCWASSPSGDCGACCAASSRAATSARDCSSTASAAPNPSAPTTPAGASRESGRRSPPASTATRYSSAPSAVFPRSRPAVSRPSRTSAAVVVGVWQIEAGLPDDGRTHRLQHSRRPDHCAGRAERAVHGEVAARQPVAEHGAPGARAHTRTSARPAVGAAG